MKWTVKTKIKVDTKTDTVEVYYFKSWFWFIGEWILCGSYQVDRLTSHKITDKEIVSSLWDKIDVLNGEDLRLHKNRIHQHEQASQD